MRVYGVARGPKEKKMLRIFTIPAPRKEDPDQPGGFYRLAEQLRAVPPKGKLYTTYLWRTAPGFSGVCFRAASKDVHLWLGLLSLNNQHVLADIFEKALGEEDQVLIHFEENGPNADKSILLMKTAERVEGGANILVYTLVPTH